MLDLKHTARQTPTVIAAPSWRRMAAVNAVMAAIVVVGWLLLAGERGPAAMGEHWPVVVTMVFGSLVGGGTSEGGGAIAFPVLTKLLGIGADDARLFCFAIQSIGMVCASISILASKVPVERRVLALGGPIAMAAGAFSVVFIAPHVSLPMVRVVFTLVLAGLGLAMIYQGRARQWNRNQTLPVWGRNEVVVISIGAAGGGALSGVAGLGENTVMFVLLVLLFRISEKVATPTTVVLLSAVSLSCFLTHVFVIGDFIPPVTDYWLAAAPVVAIGAPIGALLCTRMSVQTIRNVLFVLIAIEWVSTLLLVPMSPLARLYFICASLLAAPLIGLFTLVRRYDRGGPRLTQS